MTAARQLGKGLLAILAGAVLQFGLAPRVGISGARPDFLLLLVVAWALRRGMVSGLLMGAGAGFLEDAVLGQYLGVRTLAMAVAGVATGYAQRKVFGDQPLVPVTATLGASLLCETLSWLWWRAAGVPLPFWRGLVQVVIPVSLYNGLLTPLLLGWWWRFRANRGVTPGV
ncbi:MAG TPA: rod shape-determining protein MreD [Firmicutes bacterium]|nr:rod shape-determining protein MreD [Bacillota bacterium]